MSDPSPETVARMVEALGGNGEHELVLFIAEACARVADAMVAEAVAAARAEGERAGLAAVHEQFKKVDAKFKLDLVGHGGDGYWRGYAACYGDLLTIVLNASVSGETPEEEPDPNLYTEAERFVAGALSTLPQFANDHPAICLPMAKRALEAMGEWVPGDDRPDDYVPWGVSGETPEDPKEKDDLCMRCVGSGRIGTQECGACNGYGRKFS